MYKIILMDFSMPEMDGPQTTERILELFRDNPMLSGENNENNNVPFICCCTAYDDISYQRKAMKSGMSKFLTKPISKKDL